MHRTHLSNWLCHRCRPNCHHAWHSTLKRQTVHALRDIAAGEEITVAYVGGAELGVRESRRAKLLRQYHFACGCEACRLEGTELARSEVRQRRIAEIQSALPTWPEDLPSLVDELLQLLADEGMPTVWGASGMLLAVVRCQQRGDLASAAAWARRGADCALVALGEDSSLHCKFESLAAAFGRAVRA